MKIGLIGGYSLYKVLNDYSERTINGKAVCFFGRVDKKYVYVIPRHGKDHRFPPHKIPLIDYFEFLKKEQVKDLITVHSVGVINENWKMPCLAMIDDFIDFTGELATIHDYFDKRPVHAEMDEPYSKVYQRQMERAIRPSGIQFYRGTYMQMIGPRLETKAEIRASRTLGADMVGMTHSWEAILAKEYGMKLVSLGMGVNYASGVNNTKLSSDDIMNKSTFLSKKTVGIIRKFIEEM